MWWMSLSSAMMVAPGLEFSRNPGHLPTAVQCHAAGDILSLLRARLSQSVRGAGLLLLRLWCWRHLVWCVFGGSRFRLALLHASPTRLYCPYSLTATLPSLLSSGSVASVLASGSDCDRPCSWLPIFPPECQKMCRVSRIPKCVAFVRVCKTSLFYPIPPMSNLLDLVVLSQPVKSIL